MNAKTVVLNGNRMNYDHRLDYSILSDEVKVYEFSELSQKTITSLNEDVTAYVLEYDGTEYECKHFLTAQNFLDNIFGDNDAGIFTVGIDNKTGSDFIFNHLDRELDQRRIALDLKFHRGHIVFDKVFIFLLENPVERIETVDKIQMIHPEKVFRLPCL